MKIMDAFVMRLFLCVWSTKPRPLIWTPLLRIMSYCTGWYMRSGISLVYICVNASVNTVKCATMTFLNGVIRYSIINYLGNALYKFQNYYHQLNAAYLICHLKIVCGNSLFAWKCHFMKETHILMSFIVQFVPIKTLQSLHEKFRAINESFETNLDCTMITRDESYVYRLFHVNW